MPFLKQKENSFIKILSKRSVLKSQISESTKSGPEKLFFLQFTQKPLQIHNGTKNRLNKLYTDC